MAIRPTRRKWLFGYQTHTDEAERKTDRLTMTGGLLLALAGIVGVAYDVGINIQGMLARGATDYSFIGTSIAEWLLVLVAGPLIAMAARKR